MKHSILLTILLATLSTQVAAASTTPTTTPTKVATPSAQTSTIKLDKLKERLATKVAELRTSEKRAIFGTVKSKSITTIVVETKTKDIKIELSDDVNVVQYLKGKRTTLALDDIEKGDNVTVYGDYDTTLELLKATFVLIQSIQPMRVSGTVEATNRGDFSLTLKGLDGQTYIIDIESTTKVTRWDNINKFTKSGFSKMNTSDAIHVIGTPVPKKENRISAIRILNLGNPIGEPAATPTPTPTPEEFLTPTPTKKTSPTPKQ